MRRWGIAVGLLVGWGCAAPVTGPPPALPDAPRLAVAVLGVSHQAIGIVQPPYCEGSVSGHVDITLPSGEVERRDVPSVELTEQACIAGLGGGGACTTRPRAWVLLTRFDFDSPGEYRISGEGLGWSCAAKVTFVAARVAVLSRGGEPLALRDDEPMPALVVEPTREPETPRETATGVCRRSALRQGAHAAAVETDLPPESRATASSDAAARWAAHRRANDEAMTRALAERLNAVTRDRAGAWTMKPEVLMTPDAPTWVIAGQNVAVLYCEQRERQSQARSSTRLRVCPPNRPVSACHDVRVRRAFVEQASLAAELIYDRHGTLVRETYYPPALESSEREE